MIIGHGGNKRRLAQDLGCKISDITDMSSNLNPLGPPKRIETFIRGNLAGIRSLPEPDARSMKNGFARFYGIDPGRVVAGNGTTFFIYTLPLALDAKKVLILGPTYSDYKDACIMHGVLYDHFVLRAENNFSLDVELFSKQVEQSDMVFICNPNNPTGSLISKQMLVWLFKKHPNTLFVLDESYLPFVDQAEQISFVSDEGFDNLVVLSSMSKVFTIPGLRTGFLSAAPSISEKVMAHYQPWSVNSLAQAVIVDIFDHPEEISGFYEQTRSFIREEKRLFVNSLKQVKGLRFFPSNAYFVLAQLTCGVSSDLFCEKIGTHRILIRDCENFVGLSKEFVRFSLKKRAQNQQLATLIKEVLTHG